MNLDKIDVSTGFLAHHIKEMAEKAKENTEIFAEIENKTKQGHRLFQDGDVVNSYWAYEKALQLARETNEGFTVRACLFNLGACCVAKGEASKGLEFLLRAIPPEKESDGCLNSADLQFNLAVAYDVLGQPSEAKRCYEVALEGYKELSNQEMEGEVFLKLGGTLTSLNLLKEAAEIFQEGERVFQKLVDDRHEVLCLSSRATLLAEMRNEQCQEIIKVVVERIAQLKDDLLKAKVYSDAGLVYTSAGQYENAAEYLKKSLILIQSTEGDKKLEASVCQNLGAVHNQLGSYVKAITFHEKAIELYGLLGMRYAQGHSFSNLGFAFGQVNKLEKSAEYFMHALQAAKDCHDYRGQWQANEGLSAVSFKQNDYEKAVSYLKAALTAIALSGMNDITIHDRIVSKLSNALENQLVKKNQLGTKPTYKSAVMREKNKDPANVDGTPPRNTPPRIGNIRPREKNHKLIARGLQVDDEHVSDEEDPLSDSTFDSISSFSGSHGSTDSEEEGEQRSTEQASPGKSELNSSTPVKKDPLNNTYEEPQDIIQVIESDRLNLNNQEHEQKNPENTQSSNGTTKSRTCAIQ